MISLIKRSTLIIACLLFVTVGHAQVPERPSPPKLYNNFSKEFPDFLSPQEAAQLEEKLEVFSNETSNQICVVIVDDLGGSDAGSYATELGQSWGIGQKDKNNGIVVLVKPTKGDGGRQLFISVGYGLEGAIPDLATKRIREDEIQPLLKQGRYYEALDNGTTVLMQLAKGEINVKNYTRGQNQEGSGVLAIIVIIIFVLIFLRNMFGGGRGGGTMSGIGKAIFWGSVFSGGHSRGHGGGSSWGGGSGGGFGGFGGGSFGGGGSGGSW
jgi:uncharacterized protein